MCRVRNTRVFLLYAILKVIREPRIATMETTAKDQPKTTPTSGTPVPSRRDVRVVTRYARVREKIIIIKNKKKANRYICRSPVFYSDGIRFFAGPFIDIPFGRIRREKHNYNKITNACNATRFDMTTRTVFTAGPLPYCPVFYVVHYAYIMFNRYVH
jgi:hypothetical protein